MHHRAGTFSFCPGILPGRNRADWFSVVRNFPTLEAKLSPSDGELEVEDADMQSRRSRCDS
jgi:hypothetical protein